MYIYHYTTRDNLEAILRDGKVLMSSPYRDNSNYRYGHGVYLTMLSPEEKKKINRNNYDGYRRDNNTECYLKFSFDSLQELGLQWVAISSRDVWKVPKDIPINGNLISSGNTEDGSEGEIFFCSSWCCGSGVVYCTTAR